MGRTPINRRKILGDEIKEIDITATELSRQLKVPENRMSQIISGKRNISADTALRLGRWLGMAPAFWLNLQNGYELHKAAQKIGKEYRRYRRPTFHQ